MDPAIEPIQDDDFSFALTLQLQLLSEEADDADLETARTLLASDLKHHQQIEEDKRLAASLYRATALDGEIITQELGAENRVQQDREFAQKLEQTGEELPPEPAQPAAVPVELVSSDPTVQGIYEDYVHEISDVCWNAGATEATSSEAGSAIEERTRASKQTVICVACDDIKDTFDIIRVRCTHFYCLDCLYQVFRGAMEDQGRPPQCCKQPIATGYAADILEDQEIARYIRLQPWTTAGSKKIQCSTEGCDALVYSSSTDSEIGLCFDCNQTTCLLCQEKSHDGECPQDTETQALLELADVKKWQRCSSCSRVVELESGCYHIYCKCGAQFCYICGANWKTCSCDLWSEPYIMGGGGQGNNAPRRQNVSFAENATIKRRAVIDELRSQADQHQVTRMAQITALQLLRKERRKKREKARVQKMILNAESLEKKAFYEEQNMLERRKQAAEMRRIQLGRLFTRLLSTSQEKMLHVGKGKAKAVKNPVLTDVTERLIEYTLVAEKAPFKVIATSINRAIPKPSAILPPVRRVEEASWPMNAIYTGVLRLVGV